MGSADLFAFINNSDGQLRYFKFISTETCIFPSGAVELFWIDGEIFIDDCEQVFGDLGILWTASNFSKT